MKTPPIPPALAKYFVRSGTIFKVEREFDIQTGACVDITDPPDAWRPIISGFCRSGWIDEAQRLGEIRDNWLRQPAIDNAIENANLWQKWGKQ